MDKQKVEEAFLKWARHDDTFDLVLDDSADTVSHWGELEGTEEEYDYIETLRAKFKEDLLAWARDYKF